MNHARWAPVAGIVLLSAAILTGCAPTPIGAQSDQQIPDELLADPAGPWAFTVDGDLFLGLSGSSSCPPIPTDLEQTGDSEVTVTISRGPAIACTADAQLTVWLLPAESVPSTVELVEGDERATLPVVQG